MSPPDTNPTPNRSETPNGRDKAAFHRLFIIVRHNARIFSRAGGSSSPLKHRRWAKFAILFGVSLAFAGVAVPLARAGAKKTQGKYHLTVVVGSLAGGGDAQVSDQSVTFSSEVSESNGKGKGKGKGPKNGKKNGSVSGSSTSMADNRFRASGTALGEAVTIVGRVDPPDTSGGVLKKARLVATFVLSDGTKGRIVGYLED